MSMKRRYTGGVRYQQDMLKEKENLSKEVKDIIMKCDSDIEITIKFMKGFKNVNKKLCML
jgi:hypothetical protein